MTKFRNLKIAITEEQPLEEVVRELRRQGYMQAGVGKINEKWVITSEVGLYIGVNKLSGHRGLCTATLAELKEME